MAQVDPDTTHFRPSTPHAPVDAAPISPRRMTGAGQPQITSYRSGHRNLDVFSPVDQNGSFCFDRVIKRGKVYGRVKMKGAWKRSWKPAYLVLRPNLLSIYKNEDETDLRASITLSDVTAVAPVRKPHIDNVFGVFSPSKNFHFQGVSAPDAADWIVQIRSEANSEEQEELELPAPHVAHGQHDTMPFYEFTDVSADESPVAPGSPDGHETSGHGRPGPASRSDNRTRRPSHAAQDDSGNEHLTTSQSDFSDTLAGSLPKIISTSMPNPSTLTPIMPPENLRPRSATRTTFRLSSAATPYHDLSVDHPERVIRQGYLRSLRSHKTGVKAWKRLWVVLRPKSLSFYKNDQEYSAVKILPMDSIISAAEIDPVSKSKSFCFQVIMDDKSYRLCAPSEEELARWLGALKSVLSKRKEAEKALGKLRLSETEQRRGMALE